MRSRIDGGEATAASGGGGGAGARWMAALGVAAATLLAFGIRALGFEGVFVGDEVLFAIGDGPYHARLALYSFVNFPSVLTFDPYINYPDGASVPSPPLLDLAVAAAARALGGGAGTLERVLAWWSPATGALTTLPVYFAARTLAGRGAALGAALLVASVPILATASHVGNADHHAAQGLLGAVLLWLSLAAVGPSARPTRWVMVGMALAATRLVIAVSWSGSLLYLGLADSSILLCAVWFRHRDVLAVASISALVAGLLLVPVVLWLPTPVGGPYSAVSLSRLHLCVLLGAGSVGAGAWLLETWRPDRGPVGRLLGLAGLVAGVVGSVLLLPGPRQGLGVAMRFLATAEESGLANFELLPLLPVFGRPVGQPPELYFGYLAYLIPIAPAASLLAARDPGRRPAAALLALWTAILGAMAIWQVRYGLDFAAGGSIAFAILLGGVARLLVRGSSLRGLRPALALALGTAMLWAPIRHGYLPGAERSLRALGGQRPTPEQVVGSAPGSLLRFLQEVREVTPDTAGYLEPGYPEYGVLCRPGIGHALHYTARRASAADGIFPPAGPANFRAAKRFFEVHSEEQAVALANRLRARYVVTMSFPGIRPDSMEGLLQLEGGMNASRGVRLERFRLITEGPRGGRPLSDLFGLPRPPHVVPYRLFEIVPGAILEVPADPAATVTASVRLRTPLDRSFVYEARGVAGDEGLARLRVPYPTDRSAATFALGPYAVRSDGGVHAVAVSEAAVRDGAVVPVPRPGSEPRAGIR